MKSWWRKAPAAANDDRLAIEAGGAERALRRLEWTVIRRLDGLLQGDYRTLMRGTGLDLADLREYQHHDDVRHIDWNVTARLQTPHVRVFTEDREMAAWFVLDLSRSVDFGSGLKAKREISAGFVGVLARLLTRHGNRVGALVYGTDLEAVIPPRSGRRHVLHLLHAMERRAGKAEAAPAQKGMTRLADLLKSAAVTARLQTPHVRVFTEDREMAAWFVLDLSRSVDFGSGLKAKREISAGFVGVLARLLTRHGNRVGALVYGSDLEAVIPPRTGRRHVLHLLHAMEKRAGKAEPLQKGMTRLADLLKSAATLMPRRSTVFVVSDFLSEPGWERPLGQLVQRHEVVAVRLFDPLELELPDLGLVPLRDAETGEQLWVDTHDAGFRKRFARLAAEREAALREALARSGVDALELSTNDDLVEAIVRFADLRKRRARIGQAGMKAVAA